MLRRRTVFLLLGALGFPFLAGAAEPGSAPRLFPIAPSDASERIAVARQAALDPGLIRLEAAVFDPLGHGEPDFGAMLPRGPSLRSAERQSADSYLVQFERPVSAAQHRVLTERGAEILAAVPNRALWVRLPSAASAELLSGIDGVRYVGRLHPGYKLSPALFHEFGETGAEPVSIDISLLPGEDADAISTAIQSRFPTVSVRHIKRSHPPRVTAVVPSPILKQVSGSLIGDSAVQFVSRRPELELHNDNAVWVVQSYDRASGPSEAQTTDPITYPASAPIWNQGLTGAGQIIAISDTGLEYDTCFFSDPSNPTIPQTVAPPGDLLLQTGHRKILALNAPVAGALSHDDSFRHGTHVSASAAGDSLANPSSGSFAGHDSGDGVAPGARIIFEDISGGVTSNCSTSISVASIQELLDQEYRAGARISTNSWGTGSVGYDSFSVEVDQNGWDREDFLVFFSAGNSGAAGLSGDASCKNCMVVGASENYDAAFGGAFGGLDPENMTAFSSRGPTLDGRIKPDLTTPGYLVYSARFPTLYVGSAGDPACDAQDVDVCFPGFGGCYLTDTSQTCSVQPLLGTSMAAPIAAGSAALARQYFTDGFYPTGQPRPEHLRFPTAAALKAVLINGSRNMTGRLYERRGSGADLGPLDDAPSHVQGWGRLVLDDSLYFAGDSRRLVLLDVTHASGLATGETREIQVGVADSAQPLKITLVWTDPPGPVFAGPSLINDLDLELSAPDATVFRGNQWTADSSEVPDDKQSLAGAPATDVLNNVEGVLIQTPQAGTYTVRVRATAVPGAAGISTQGFALVVTGGLTPGTAAPVPDGTYGSPMRADRPDGSGATIDLSWDVGTCPSEDYHVLHGPLAGVGTLQVDGSVCDLGSTGSYRWSGVPAGDRWFLVVADDDLETEGPWGEQSDGTARNALNASGACNLSIRVNNASCP